MRCLLMFLSTLLFFSCVKREKINEPILADKPPMGWNSWNAFEKDINEENIKKMADLMISSGMKDAGYEYLVLDDAWMAEERDSFTNRLIPDPEKFPSGMKAIGDYIHSKGLKFGIYECRGHLTCQNLPGSFGFEELDMQTFAEWGVDYIKMDACFAAKNGRLSSEDFEVYHNAIKKTGREMILSISDFGSGAWAWEGKKYAQLWRTSGDIYPFIKSVYRCAETSGGDGSSHPEFNGLWQFAGPGHWNDPDMLQVGNLENARQDSIHFALWCILAAPLMAGNDLSVMSDTVREILTAKELIDVNQDDLRVQGFKVYDEGDAEIYNKPLSDGTTAVLFINKGEKPVSLTLDFKKVGLNGEQLVRDLWEKEDLGYFNDKFTTNVLQQHQQCFVKIGEKSKRILPMPKPLSEDRYVIKNNSYLSDYCYIQKTGNHPVSNLTYKNKKICFDGKTYEKGLGCKAKTSIIYKLDTLQNHIFRSTVFLDPDSKDDAKGKFRVLEEDSFGNRVLYQSKQMKKGDSEFINIKLDGVKLILLEFTGSKDAMGIWADTEITSY